MEKQYPRSRNREYGATQRVEGNKVQFEEATLNQEGAKNSTKIVLILGIFLIHKIVIALFLPSWYVCIP